MKEPITYVGLDSHKDRISVTLAETSGEREVRYLGEIDNTAEAIGALVEKLDETHDALAFCYEAGPCGYGIHRQIAALGHDCTVVAPSLIPRRPGDRVKTNRRDATMLARLHRAGELTAVWVPDAEHEAMRDLVRAREVAMEDLRRARQRLGGFLLRHGRIYTGRTNWTKAHRAWLARQRFDHAAQQIVFQDYLEAITDAAARLDRRVGQIEALLPSWSLAPVVEAFQLMRGVALISAVTVVAEIGDFTRFDNPRQLMAYLGLVPSEASTGHKVRRGGITKAGNTRVRRVLVEGAWSYRLPARVAEKDAQRWHAAPKAAREIAWKAQTRLCPRYRRLIANGKPKNVVTVAIAREMAAFLWAIAQQVKPTTPSKTA